MSYPSKEDSGTLERGMDAYPAPALDNAVTSDQWSASPPSPSALWRHPHHCATIPSTAAPSPMLREPRTTRHRHPRCCAPYALPLATPLSQRTDGDQTGSSHTATLEAAPGREQDSYKERPKRTLYEVVASVASWLSHAVRNQRPKRVPLDLFPSLRHK
jgi:hypothetical protein